MLQEGSCALSGLLRKPFTLDVTTRLTQERQRPASASRDRQKLS